MSRDFTANFKQSYKEFLAWKFAVDAKKITVRNANEKIGLLETELFAFQIEGTLGEIVVSPLSYASRSVIDHEEGAFDAHGEKYKDYLRIKLGITTSS